MTRAIPTTADAYKLLHEGALALAEAERYGISVDVPYCEKKLTHLHRQTNRLFEKMEEEPEIKLWRSKYKKNTKITSDDQLEDILYNELGLKPLKSTKNEDTKKGSVDQESLGAIDLPFVNMILETRKIKTVVDDLTGILQEEVNGLVHPSYTLNIVQTYRSSCMDPNLQNMPIRDPIQGKTVRRAFLPRAGNCLLEIDYGGVEVHGAAWYHKDPTMLSYLSDLKKDLHRDMASQIYMLDGSPAAYWKDKTPGMGHNVRYCGKNRYVFPVFYGSYYVECAKNLWAAINEFNLKGPGEIPVKKILREKGIKGFKDFEKHIQDVEEDFWNRRFKVYADWKDEWYDRYVETGFFESLTGFRYQGVLRRNQVINYPVQGVAFHCLLWAFTRITEEAISRGWKSRPVLQIHDSIILDTDPDELYEVWTVCHDIMIDQLKKNWDFIITPIEIEADITPVNGSWFDKKSLDPDSLSPPF